MPWVSASVGDDIGSFFAAVGKFFENLARIDPALLALGLLCFGIYLTFRARAFFHVLQAAYPAERVAFRRIWGRTSPPTASTTSSRRAAGTSSSSS